MRSFINSSSKSSGKAGFTLLEMLLVIAIIAILAAIVIVAINPARQLAQARNAQRASDINSIYKALQQYYIDNREYPWDDSGYLGDVPNADEASEICGTGATTDSDTCVELEEYLVPTYLSALPQNPANLNYVMALESRKISVGAPGSAEQELSPVYIGNNDAVIAAAEATTTSGGGSEEYPECSDGEDNDTDGKTDYPSDPGCDSEEDDSEAGEVMIYLSCADILEKEPDSESGVYSIQPDSVDSPFDVYCDMDTDGGGWTLILKTAQSGSTFTYSSAYWTNSSTLNDSDTTLNSSDMKNLAYTNISFSEYRISLHSVGNYVIESLSADSMLALISSGKNTTTSQYDNYLNMYHQLNDYTPHTPSTNTYSNGANLTGAASTRGNIRLGATCKQYYDASWGLSWGLGLVLHGGGLLNHRYSYDGNGAADAGWLWVR